MVIEACPCCFRRSTVTLTAARQYQVNCPDCGPQLWRAITPAMREQRNGSTRAVIYDDLGRRMPLPYKEILCP
jgi:hypothetical protein